MRPHRHRPRKIRTALEYLIEDDVHDSCDQDDRAKADDEADGRMKRSAFAATADDTILRMDDSHRHCPFPMIPD